MGHRLSKIYTRTGDDGSTGLGDGTRVAKDSARVEAYGTVDELNSVLGVLLAHGVPPDIVAHLADVQNELFDLGGELCIPDRRTMTQTPIDRLEKQLDRLNEQLSPLKEFILPGGSATAAYCHIARTVCRRAERRVIALARTKNVNPLAIAYLNRLSDYLFVLARHLNKSAGHADILWKPGKTTNQ
ncbi:MAG TPA: cob(I)yrinic acid a,c-diamide adenosyltransferase [Burkholderiales bacterium]|nr:cob(I)yrinic acid a,c-diamide adenosyltransferase [Burkholderiales bacterium]